MTRQKSFKRFVRARMDKTGESYTRARAVLLAAAEQPSAAEQPALITSDETIRRRSGRGWEEWFDLLDKWQAATLSHKEIARLVAQELRIDPLVWEAQAVTISYERARGMRVVGQRADGFAVTAAKTVAVPIDRLFDAVVDASLRHGWLPDDQLHERTATRPKTARFDWADGTTRVNINFVAKDDAKSTMTLEHTRLVDASDADTMKTYWRQALRVLGSKLESGELDG